jgi:ABC-type uncharacterized transport system auxiliary subunit
MAARASAANGVGARAAQGEAAQRAAGERSSAGGQASGVRKASAAGALLLLLAACVGGPAPRDHFYLLSPPAPAARPQPVLAGVLQVERFRTDALTRERSILSVDDPSSVQVVPYSYHLWVDSPTLMLQRRLADHMFAARVAERVVLPGMSVQGDWVMSGWIEHLIHVTEGGSGRVLVELELSLARARAGDLLLRRRYRVERPVEGDSVDAAVRAFGEAVGEIFSTFEADVVAAAPS